MKATAEQSAELMQALKHDPVTDALRAEAEAFPAEAAEALANVEGGLDEASPDSWVAEQL
jgi:hypothetical protein